MTTQAAAQGAHPVPAALQPSTDREVWPDHEERLSAIFEIAKTLVTEQDLGPMLNRFLDSLLETLRAADAGSLWFCDPADGLLRSKSARGYDLDAWNQMALVPGEGMAGSVFADGQARLFSTPDETADAMANLTPANRELFNQATAGVARPLSAITVPLIAGEHRIGALSLLNLRQRPSFAPDDLIFLQRVADLISLAIENFRLREELEAAQALSEANRLKSELISTLAHEMRTPLTSIKGYSTALLMDDVSFEPATQREFLQIIDEETDVLQALIHDLLESSIIDAGLLKIEPQPVRLPALAQAAVEDVGRHARQHRFVVDFQHPFPIIDADPDRVSQVLRNLLDNAVKYSPEGGLIVLRGEVRPGEVVISVADQGIGIAPEHLNRLFEKFWRAKSGLGRHVVGSGLGLPICHTIVESHGGQIWAESQPAQGSTFYFTLPAKDQSQDRE